MGTIATYAAAVSATAVAMAAALMCVMAVGASFAAPRELIVGWFTAAIAFLAVHGVGASILWRSGRAIAGAFGGLKGPAGFVGLGVGTFVVLYTLLAAFNLFSAPSEAVTQSPPLGLVAFAVSLAAILSGLLWAGILWMRERSSRRRSASAAVQAFE